jgi:DNA-directed RNA polymerase subunit RPC12/RpoP
MRTNITYPASKAVEAGLAGGFVGALIMGGLALMMPVNGQPFFVAAAMLMGLSGTMATAAGWMLHLITGLIVGAIFGVAITKVNTFRVTDIKRGLAWGLGAGVLVWAIFFLPMMMASGMANMLGSTLMAMVLGSFGAHLVYGLILGGIVGAVLPKSVTASVQAYKCPTCGATFRSQSALMEHGKMHIAAKATAEYKCPTCAASFKSQSELMEHAGKHKVLAS